NLRIQPISLNLRISNQPRFERIGQDHFINGIDLLKQIVNTAPVPTCFQHHFARPFESRKRLSETKSLVGINTAPVELLASLVYCNKHTVALVNSIPT